MGINDPVQQKHWIEETNKLWENAQNGNFEFKTIDDVLEENAACKEENENLLQQIEDLNNEIEDLNNENAACKQENEDLNNENEDLNNENAACKQENEDLNNKNEDLNDENEDLNKELTDIYSSEIIALHILTADVQYAGCDNCEIYATIFGPDGGCSTSSKLYNTADDKWRRGNADVFSGIYSSS